MFTEDPKHEVNQRIDFAINEVAMTVHPDDSEKRQVLTSLLISMCRMVYTFGKYAGKDEAIKSHRPLTRRRTDKVTL